MFFSKLKSLVSIFVLLPVICIVSVGCTNSTPPALMNTSSLPGHTFAQNTQAQTPIKSTSKVIYIGADSAPVAYDARFGPREVSFEFEILR